jgi:hypothetical protein
MALNTFSSFYYGFTVDSTNNLMDLSEIGGTSGLQAVINTGSYTLTDFLVAVKTALDAAGTGTYALSVARDTRLITVDGPTGGFSLLTNSGSGTGSSPWGLMGFSTASDQTGATGYTGGSAAGFEYQPQFRLQDYVSGDDWEELVDVNVIESANGDIETFAFGTRNFIQANISYANNYTQSNTSVIKNNATGVEALRQFMVDVTKKRPFEFIPDISQASTYQEVLLESTPQSKDGTGFRLKEMYSRGMPGYYETGTIRLRVLT